MDCHTSGEEELRYEEKATLSQKDAFWKARRERKASAADDRAAPAYLIRLFSDR